VRAECARIYVYNNIIIAQIVFSATTYHTAAVGRRSSDVFFFLILSLPRAAFPPSPHKIIVVGSGAARIA